MVGATRFERATLWSQTRCATKLRYAPKPHILPRRRAHLCQFLWAEVFVDRIGDSNRQCAWVQHTIPCRHPRAGPRTVPGRVLRGWRAVQGRGVSPSAAGPGGSVGSGLAGLVADEGFGKHRLPAGSCSRLPRRLAGAPADGMTSGCRGVDAHVRKMDRSAGCIRLRVIRASEP